MIAFQAMIVLEFMSNGSLFDYVEKLDKIPELKVRAPLVLGEFAV